MSPQLPHLHYVTSYVCAKMNCGIVKMWQMFGKCWCTFVATNSYILIKSTMLWNLCRFGKPAQNVCQCLKWVSVMTPARLTQLASVLATFIKKLYIIIIITILKNDFDPFDLWNYLNLILMALCNLHKQTRSSMRRLGISI